MPASFADYYNGGYLGFMTYDTQAVFRNVRYSDDGDFLVGEFYHQFDWLAWGQRRLDRAS